MFGSVGYMEIVVLLVAALLIFGPDKLPGLVKDAAHMLRTVRGMAKDARKQIKTELGPEFSDFDMDSLNPRSFVRKNLFEDDDEDDERSRRAARGSTAAPRTPGEKAPYDPDTI